MSDPRNVRLSSAAVGGGEAGCLPPGYQLHEFVIDSVLGEGGFGVVYAATDTRLERRVAIKEYMPTALATRDAEYSVHARSSAEHQEAFVAGLRSFVNEAKLLARFEHPSLVKVYQFWEERGTAYMVMPLHTAPTFKKWVRQRTAPVEEEWLLAFLDGLIDALEVLHKENCLHRDIAPDNILVLNDSQPLLLDFGAARRVIGDLTHNLTVILKPGFAPVEQYAETSALKQGPWTDVYALAAVGYFAITGKAPVAAVGRMVSDELVPLREAAAGRYSQRLLSALDLGLRVRPEERPLSMQALRAYLFADAVFDEKTTVISQRPAPPLSPAPNALHSTFKPKNDGSVDEDATRLLTDAPAKPGVPKDAALPGQNAATLSPSAAPTFKLPRRGPASGAPPPAQKAERSAGPWLWVGSFAAGGAALVFGAAWLLGGPTKNAPATSIEARTATAPAVEPVKPAVPSAAAPAPEEPSSSQPAPAAPSVSTSPPTPAPATSSTIREPPGTGSAAPAPASPPTTSASPLASKSSPPPVSTKPAAPAVAPSTKPAPAPVAESKPLPTPTPPPAAKAAPPLEPKVAEAPKPSPPAPAPPPPVVRAPEGPPPLAVSDKGLIDLQIDGTVDPKAKEPRFAGYTCCNLHYSGDWVSDLNYSSDTRIPAGAPIRIVEYGRWRLITEIEGKKIRIGLDYGRRQETLAQFARKLTVDKDLRFRMAAFPASVQDAIHQAKVMPGMSKEQVVMSVGFPARHETPSVDAADWRMWHSSRVPYTLHFDERGRVKEVEIDPESRSKVVFGAKN
jgi:serine/threonine protein kinase